MTRVFLSHSWRTRWRGLAVLALMIALTGAVSLAALAGARRSASALDRFHDAAQTHDVFVAGDITTPEPAALAAVLDGPLVDAANDLVFLLVDAETSGVVFAPTSRRGLQVEQGVLLDGRRADPDDPDEVVLPMGTARHMGLGVGDTFEVGSITPAQAEAMFSRGEEPTSLDGPQLRLRVVGIVRNGFDLAADGTTLTMTTPAFWEKFGEEIGVGSRSHMVRLVDEPDALERFTDAVEEAYRGEHLPSINIGGQGDDAIAGSIAVITAALVAVALVIAVAGVVWVGLATARHERLAGPELEVLRALGATAGERRLLLVGSVLPALIVGVALAPLVAVALSPLFPVGVARNVDPDPGLHVDAATLLLGGAALLVILGVIAMVAAARLVHRDRGHEAGMLRVPPLVDLAASWLPPAPGNGVRFALHTPPHAGAPVRSALAGALVGVLGLVAVVVVGASLQRLVDTPPRWGTTWDVAARAEFFAAEGDENQEPGAAPEVDRYALLADADVAAAAVLLYDEQVTINGVEAISMTLDPLKGEMVPTVIEGREPRADDEIAVGRDTFDEVGVALGTTVTVGSRSQLSEAFRIVGVIAFPTIGEPTAVATGASFTARGGDRLLLGDESGGEDVGTPYVALRWAPGVDHDEALARRGIELNGNDFEVRAAGPTAPPEVDGLADVQQFPLVAGAGLVVLGVVATGHALIVTVRRRRLDLAVLSALGLAPAQRRVLIHGQVTTISVIALLVGLPLGLVAGRLVWSAVAESMGLVPDASFPLVLLAAGAIGMVVALNLVAAFPARSARRLRVADTLRSE